MDEKRFKEQANELNDMMEQINNNSSQPDRTDEKNSFHYMEQMDLLNLPPRSQVHANKNTKTKMKWGLKYPLVRLLFILFILIVVLVLTFNRLWGKDLFKTSEMVELPNSHAAGEMVQIIASEQEIKQRTTKVEQKGLPTVPWGIETSQHNKPENDTIEGEQKQANEPFYYEVTKDDTFFSIAMEFYGEEQGKQWIKEANGLTDEQVEIGQSLLIPNYTISEK